MYTRAHVPYAWHSILDLMHNQVRTCIRMHMHACAHALKLYRLHSYIYGRGGVGWSSTAGPLSSITQRRAGVGWSSTAGPLSSTTRGGEGWVGLAQLDHSPPSHRGGEGGVVWSSTAGPLSSITQRRRVGWVGLAQLDHSPSHTERDTEGLITHQRTSCRVFLHSLDGCKLYGSRYHNG